MKSRPDLFEAKGAPGLEIFQLTEGPTPCSHIYMEAQIFSPDSKRFVLHRSASPHGSNKDDSNHCYLLCDLENRGELVPMTFETGATAPSLTPDGKYLYYFVNETVTNGGKLTLKRAALDGSERNTILVLDAPIPDTPYRPSQIYPLSTISSDGNRLALAAFLGDGETQNAPWGLIIFDLRAATVQMVLEGPSWLNLHPQYCRATDAEAAHDIMVQENHGGRCDLTGTYYKLTGGKHADIHLIRDDGTRFRNFPWGRDGNEVCQGHQCWRGQSLTAITSTDVQRPRGKELIESLPLPFAGHIGIATPGGQRNVLSRDFPEPRFCHFATDRAGQRLVSDAYTDDRKWLLYAAEFGADGEALRDWRFLLDTRSSTKAHPHPFLAPDGAKAFFNSDESGALHAYMVSGL
ncbi:MAG: PD40 domain-containing protein [Candidatus Hydrogenedentes bacterium]|nr:PD40 domain-containing protein [Candidatus Hydrogenedentota bacterium]